VRKSIKYKTIFLITVTLSITVACNQEDAETYKSIGVDNTQLDSAAVKLAPEFSTNPELGGLVTVHVEVLAEGTIVETISNNSSISIHLSDISLEYFDGDSWIPVHLVRDYELEGGGGGVVDIGKERTFNSHLVEFHLPSDSGLFRLKRFCFPTYREPDCTFVYELIGEFFVED